MDIFNTYEFWAVLSGFGLVVILFWRVLARKNNLPPTLEEMGAETLEIMQEFAQEKADYLKRLKELEKEKAEKLESNEVKNEKDT